MTMTENVFISNILSSRLENTNSTHPTVTKVPAVSLQSSESSWSWLPRLHWYHMSTQSQVQWTVLGNAHKPRFLIGFLPGHPHWTSSPRHFPSSDWLASNPPAVPMSIITGLQGRGTESRSQWYRLNKAANASDFQVVSVSGYNYSW